MVKLTIDNRDIEVPAGTKVINAAEQLGIMIPRFCYHPALGAVGACRVCAVAFTDGPVKGIQMSCMVNAQDGMVVSTTDDEAVDFRRHVIEWLMLNHPHDCPVCDEGGHCLLQDLTVSGGHGMRRYKGLKRTHRDQYLGPLIQHEMNRCIQCYRCARYYQEFAGSKDLGVMGIGSRVYFGRSKPGNLESRFSGNLVDICPTGVYTDKPSRFIGRRWDFQRSPSVCPHCSLGCNLVVSARYRRVVRHEARPNMDVNGHFICDRGRYGYAYTNTAGRPRKAMVKGVEGEPSYVLASVIGRLDQVIRQYGPKSVGAIGSERSSLETLATLEYVSSHHQWHGPVVDQEARKACNLKTAIGSLTNDLTVSLGAVSVAEYILIIGADPMNETPMLALSLRQAQRQGGHVAVIDPRAVDMPLDFDHLPVRPLEMASVIGHLIRAACQMGDHGAQAPSADTTAEKGGPRIDERLSAMTTRLCESRRAVIICGADITTPEEIALAAELAQTMREAGTEAKLFHCLNGPNALAAGSLIEDCHGVEALLEEIENGRIKALVVVENDLWGNHPDRVRLMKALEQLELLVLLDHQPSPLAVDADFFLPTCTIYEAGGRWINQEGRLQTSSPVLTGGVSIETEGKGGHPPRRFERSIPGGTPEAAWKWIAALMPSEDESQGPGAEAVLAAAMERTKSKMGDLQDGNRISLDPRAGLSSPSVGEIKSEAEEAASFTIDLLFVDWTLGTERLSAQTAALAELTPPPVAILHPHTAEMLNLTPGGRMKISTEKGALSLPWKPDDRMAPNVIAAPRHHLLEWQALGATKLVLATEHISHEADDGR